VTDAFLTFRFVILATSCLLIPLLSQHDERRHELDRAPIRVLFMRASVWHGKRHLIRKPAIISAAQILSKLKGE